LVADAFGLASALWAIAAFSLLASMPGLVILNVPTAGAG
jgi:hypothetical protein